METPPETAEPKMSGKAQKNRAGRDLPAALAVGLSLAAAAIASLVFWIPGIAVIATCAVLAGTFELSRALRQAGHPVEPPVVTVGAGLMLAGAWWFDLTGLLGAYLVVVPLAVAFTAIFENRVPRGLFATIFTLTYVPLLGGFALLLVANSSRPWALLLFIACTVMADTGGYLVGVWRGKHPIAPGISPKKSWEGFAGSLFFSGLAGALVCLALPIWWGWGLLLGWAITLIALVGDLSESLLKRDMGIKDMSQILPGHGGIMDRFDSLLMVAPICYVLFRILLGTW